MLPRSQPFSNLQLELLRLYSNQIEEKDLLEIKQMLGLYFAKKLVSLADDAWTKNKWSNEDMEMLLNDPNQ